MGHETSAPGRSSREREPRVQGWGAWSRSSAKVRTAGTQLVGRAFGSSTLGRIGGRGGHRSQCRSRGGPLTECVLQPRLDSRLHEGRDLSRVPIWENRPGQTFLYLLRNVAIFADALDAGPDP